MANVFHICQTFSHLLQADWLAMPLTQRKQRNNTHLYTHLSGSIVELCERRTREYAILWAMAVCMRHWDTLSLVCRVDVFRCENIIFIFRLLLFLFLFFLFLVFLLSTDEWQTDKTKAAKWMKSNRGRKKITNNEIDMRLISSVARTHSWNGAINYYRVWVVG